MLHHLHSKSLCDNLLALETSVLQYASPLWPIVSELCGPDSVSSLAGRQPQMSAVFLLAIISFDCMVITVSMQQEKAAFGRRIEREKGAGVRVCGLAA